MYRHNGEICQNLALCSRYFRLKISPFLMLQNPFLTKLY